MKKTLIYIVYKKKIKKMSNIKNFNKFSKIYEMSEQEASSQDQEVLEPVNIDMEVIKREAPGSLPAEIKNKIQANQAGQMTGVEPGSVAAEETFMESATEAQSLLGLTGETLKNLIESKLSYRGYPIKIKNYNSGGKIENVSLTILDGPLKGKELSVDMGNSHIEHIRNLFYDYYKTSEVERDIKIKRAKVIKNVGIAAASIGLVALATCLAMNLNWEAESAVKMGTGTSFNLFRQSKDVCSAADEIGYAGAILTGTGAVTAGVGKLMEVPLEKAQFAADEFYKHIAVLTFLACDLIGCKVQDIKTIGQLKGFFLEIGNMPEPTGMGSKTESVRFMPHGKIKKF